MEKMFQDDLYLICLECRNEFVFTGFQQKKAKQKSEPMDIPSYCLVCDLQQARLRAKERESRTFTGRIKWFNHTRGIGFIRSDNGDEIFLHHSGIENKRHKKLRRGQRVQFLVERREKGLQAVELRILRKKNKKPVPSSRTITTSKSTLASVPTSKPLP